VITVAFQDGTNAATLADDNWHRVTELLALEGVVAYITEAFVSVVTNGLTFVILPLGSSPVAATQGDPFPAGSKMGLGPASGKYKGWPLHLLWVKNTTAGSNGTLVVTGVLQVE
jgi:hypothetical protein